MLDKRINDFIESTPDQKLLGYLLVASILVRLPLISNNMFVGDETFYSMIITEQIQHPSIIPTLFGYPTFWKPFLFFWVYAFFVSFLQYLPIPIEAVYRLPTQFFGLINIVLLYHLLKEINIPKKIAFLTTVVYSFTFLTIYVANTVLVDTLLSTFILASLLMYAKGQRDDRKFLFAGALAFSAYFIKLIAAFIIPVLAVAYFVSNDRKNLINKYFLLSLFAVPLAALLHIGIYAETLKTPGFEDAISKELFNRLDPSILIDKFVGTDAFFVYVSAWLLISLLGVIRFWKNNVFMALWYSLILAAIASNLSYPWYYLPLIPPISYFAVMMLAHDENKKLRLDDFFYEVSALFLITGFIIGIYLYLHIGTINTYKRDVGEFLAFKDNVYLIGPGTNSIAVYKILEENRAGNRKDFGWIFVVGGLNQTEFQGFVNNYYYQTSKIKVTDGSFSRLYWEKGAYRKNTSITKPDYIAFNADNASELVVDGTLVYDSNYSKVYRMGH